MGLLETGLEILKSKLFTFHLIFFSLDWTHMGIQRLVLIFFENSPKYLNIFKIGDKKYLKSIPIRKKFSVHFC